MTKLPLALAISALLTPALVLAQNADDHPHPETKELDRVQVTASPLRSAIDDVARPISVLVGAGVGRPIIRGQEGARVQTLSGGMSSADVSTVSADHAVSIEPFLADQIEVLRGPAVLLYGSGAIAGAVNVGMRTQQPASDLARERRLQSLQGFPGALRGGFRSMS